MSRIHAHFDRELILLFLLSAFALAPLASPGYFFDAHDAKHSVFFLVEFDQALRDGVLWPRWGPDFALGYGYPLWLLYAPLAYYVAEGFHLLGLGFTAAVKATWALGFLFGGWGMFLLLRRWFGRGPAGRAAALVGGLLYVYAPYHLLNIYVRAAFAEFSAMAWFPWVLLAFDRLVSPSSHAAQSPAEGEGARSWRSVAVAALAYAGLLLTHTGSIVIFTPLLMAYLLFALLRLALAERRPWGEVGRAALRAAAGGLLAVGLAMIFLLPMLLEQRFIAQEQWVQGSYGYRGHFVYLSQWLDPFWGYGYSDDPAGPNDGLSFQLGIAGVVLALTAAVVGLRRSSPQRGVTAFFLAATLISLAAMLPLAQPLWDAVGPAALIQFPWRLLGIASLGVAILGGAAVASLLWEPFLADRPSSQSAEAAAGGNAQAPAAAVLGLAVALASLSFTPPQYTDIQPSDESELAIILFETTYRDMVGMTAATEQAFTDTPLVAQYLAGQPLEKATLLSGSGVIRTSRVGGASVTAQVDVDGPATVLFYTYDFPGWRATVNGQPVAHRAEPPYALIAVDVPAGQHEVAIRHGTTPVRTAGALISALSLLIVGWLFFWPLRRVKPGETPS